MKTRLSIFLVTLLFLALSQTPSVQAVEYQLISPDGQVKVVLDGFYGGAITQLYDYANMGNLNLIDGFQAGAMFQTAFWVLPYHNYQPPYVDNNPYLPPGCGNTGDMYLDNPTQAGFVADGRAGNPIGIMGTDSSTPDPNEFIQYEDGNKTIHFKSRFIRYDYCKNGSATMCERQWWDTDFYIEQWASLHPTLPRTLVLRSKITYAGSSQKSVTSRSLPIIFACNLPRIAYWQNAQKVISQNLGSEVGISPDYNWSALVGANTEVGVGMITSKTMVPMLGRGKFSYGELLSSIDQCSNNGPLSVVQPGSGVPDLRTLGTLTNVDGPTSDHIFTFNVGGAFDWTTYYPIGTLDQIRNTADTLLGVIPEIHGFVDRVTCDQPNTAGWATDDRNHAQKVTIRLEAYPEGEPSNKFIKYGTITNTPVPGLVGVCPPDGSCSFGITLGTLPNSFANKQIRVNIYGVAADGENLIQSAPNLIGPCGNISPPPTPTPTPTPSPSPSPSPSFTVAQLKTALANYLGPGDSLYQPVDGKINTLDTAYIIKWLH